VVICRTDAGDSEAVPVTGGRDEAAGPGGEGRLTAPLPAGGVNQFQAARRIGPVVAGEPVELGGRHLKPGIGHSERLEQPLS